MEKSVSSMFTSTTFTRVMSVFGMTLFLLTFVAACSSPAEKAEKYYEKGMTLLDKDPDKAKLEFQNALQLKKNMTKAMYGLGLVAERKGDWKGAFGLMNSVVQQDPKNINALVKTGQILLAGGKLDIALERVNKALDVDKNNVQALNLRAAIELKLNNPKGAIEYANLALTKEPGNADAYVVLATERLSAKDDAKAIEYIDKALLKDEKNLVVQLIKIRALEDLSDDKQAEQNYLKLIKLFPDTQYIRKSYVQFLMKFDRKDEAEQQLRAIALATPKELQSKLDVVRFVIATKGAAAGRAELENYVSKQPENYELAFALINLYQVQNDTVQEDKLLNQVAQKAGNTPDGLKARSLIAYKLIRAGKKDEASKMLNAILDIDKRNEQALTLRASLALDAKNYDAAIVDLRTVLRDAPDESGVSLMLASAHENSGSPELAEEQYLKAFQSSKMSSKYGIPYVQFLMRRKQPERAEKLLEDMLEANPSDAFVMRSLAQAKISRGDYVGAQALADKAKKLNDKSSLPDQILGAISSSRNDFDGSLSAFKRAHEAAPDESQPIVAVVRTYVQAGKNKEAIAFVVSVLKANPKNTEASLILGQLYSSVGDNDKANQTFSAIIQSEPNNPTGYQQLAVSQQHANQNAEAEKTIQQGLLIAPKDFGLMLTQASIYEATAKFDDAIKVYEGMLKERPDSEIVINNLASLLSDHRSDKASLTRAYDLAKTSKDSLVPQFLDTFGWASYRVGKYDEAEKALKVATEKLPEIAVFHYHLAKIYIAKNDNVLAKQALQNAIKYSENQPFDQKDEANQLLKSL